ncbi:uncharacterized protein Z518_10417 [Rhinocladiella mackenziei CBS 650.93]|uniref:Rhinocladiella mackenziei CBS 650.93 unplaced genomic scaffold supercont1.9, whole genome shotgun sequence n=1 Tax=Rhinocladiella mackenziei CBS 650.93 TaxID=1442369 RepID=A0A0D2GPH9_9EURO|nr:uncharacterized protein Z518_10417 [Rhinocladiella mackenziei CBS 650.93]KIX00278.1 hypothetical protein Z518_10417 [Rhinocladiella mackenziei CBS 650.93]
MGDHSRNLFSTWVALFLSLGSIACAYATVITATTLAQPSFIGYMSLDTAPNATQLIGAVNGVYIAGALIGSLLSSQTSDALGRRKSVFLSAALAVLGGALQAGSIHIGMFIVARLLAGLGIGSLFAAVPLYQSEVSPPKVRGLIVGLHGIFISLGTILSNWIGFGFYFVNASGSQWRVPLALQCVPTLVLATGVWFVPESPRWLINQDRHDDALRVLTRLHHGKNGSDNTFAHREYLQIREQHDEDERNKVTWAQMWTVPSYRRRTVVGFFIMFASQMTATLIVSIVYNPVLYAGLGYGTVKQLLFTGIWANITVIGNTINALTVDRMGRVLALKIGWIGDVCAMIGVVVSLAKFEETGSRASAIAAIVFLYLHIAMYAGFVDVTTYVYASEIFPNNVRGKGMSISVAAYFVALVIELDSAPTALAHIGWRLILIYLCCLAVCVPFLWFFCPETKGKSLEEIGVIFGDRHIHVPLGGAKPLEETVQISEKQALPHVGQEYEHVEG